jgi:exonuclease-1
MDIRGFKFEYFRYMCIITGCDYLSNIHGVGIKRAHTFIQKFAKSKLKIEEVLVS